MDKDNNLLKSIWAKGKNLNIFLYTYREVKIMTVTLIYSENEENNDEENKKED